MSRFYALPSSNRCIISSPPYERGFEPTKKLGTGKALYNEKEIVEVITMCKRFGVIAILFVLSGMGLVGSLADSFPNSHSRNIVDSYSWWNGFETAGIQLKADGSFEFYYQCCTGSTQGSGRYVRNASSIQFQPTDSGFREIINAHLANEMHRIRWGQREYLIPEKRMLAFINAINAGYEPVDTNSAGSFFLRDGDAEKTVYGFPDISSNWKSYLFSHPLRGFILRVVQLGGCPDSALATIDGGSRAGIKKGMRLFAFNPKRPSVNAELEVTDVFADSASVIVSYQFNRLRRMDRWSTESILYIYENGAWSLRKHGDR